MKTIILFLFSLISINGILFGQTDKLNYKSDDTNRQSYPFTYEDSLRLKIPDLFLPKEIENPTLKDFEKFGLSPDSTTFDNKKVRLYSDFVVVEGFPGASRFYGFPFVKRPDMRGKLRIIKPDLSGNVKYYLIIKDPIHHSITK